MQTIRVAAVSMNSPLGQSEMVLARVAEFCQEAKAEGAELVLFPELVVHGHCTPNTWELAESVPEGNSTRRLAELARGASVDKPRQRRNARLYSALRSGGLVMVPEPRLQLPQLPGGLARQQFQS